MKAPLKFTVIILLTSVLVSCQDKAGNNQEENAPNDLSIDSNAKITVDSFYMDENEINSNEYKQYYWCDFDQFLNNPATPKLAKDIYLEKEWNLNNDLEALALLDSLNALDISSKPFYFKVVTMTESKADGYYAEGLGYAGYHYVLNNTEEFVSFFDNKQCLTETDLRSWAELVSWEFGVRVDSNVVMPLVDQYLIKLKRNCKNCTSPQKETLTSFGRSLKDCWDRSVRQSK